MKKITKLSKEQEGAFHLWCQRMADDLNEKGLGMRKVLKESIEIDWTKDSFKKYMFKKILEVAYGLDSTKKMNTSQMNKVCDTIHRHFGEKYGVHVPFPTEKDVKADKLYKKAKKIFNQ